MVELSNPQEYFDFIESNTVALIHFWAEWNAYDRAMKECLSELEPKFINKCGFGSVDTDKEVMWRLIRDEGVLNLPALAYYKDGKHIETIIGLTRTAEEKLGALLKSGENF